VLDEGGVGDRALVVQVLCSPPLYSADRLALQGNPLASVYLILSIHNEPLSQKDFEQKTFIVSYVLREQNTPLFQLKGHAVLTFHF